jgi:nucleotide-binding universal stress UspA family protein
VERAVVGLDLEDTDDIVLKYLGFLSAHIKIEEARFVHVIPSVYLFDRKNGVESYQYEKYELDENVAKDIAIRIEQNITSTSKVKVDFDVRDGSPLDELMQSAEANDASLVVIGKSTSRDHHGILAKNFAREVNGNALLIPDKTKLILKTILVPFDFSPNSIAALRTAVAVAKCFNHPPVITALNVYELPSIQAYLFRKTVEEMRKMLLEDRIAAFKSFLDNYIPAEDRKLIQTDIIEQTHPGAGSFIMEYAETHKASLIVMGAKGHSKVGLLLMGSVTEKILGITKHIPVLVVK